MGFTANTIQKKIIYQIIFLKFLLLKKIKIVKIIHLSTIFYKKKITL